MMNRRWILPSLLGINLLIRFLVLIRPLKYIDGLIIPDDAYYYFSIARNMAHGLGPFYGVDYTNGFQPLFAFLCVPVFWLFPGSYNLPVHAILFMLAIFDTLSLFLLIKIISGITKSSFTPFFVALFWIFNAYVIRIALNGMETMVSMFFILLSLYYFQSYLTSDSQLEHSKFRSLLFGVILGLLILARIDNGFLVILLVASYIIIARKSKMPFSRVSSAILITAMGASIILLPWLLYSYYYTGMIYPLSGDAVRLGCITSIMPPVIINLYGRMIWRAVKLIYKYHRIILLLIAVSSLIVIKIKGLGSFYRIIRNNRIFIIILIFNSILLIAYTLYIFGPWYYDRYLFPLTLLFAIFISLLLDPIVLYIKKPSFRKMFMIGLALLFIAISLSQSIFYSMYIWKYTQNFGYMNLGLWARDYFEDGAVVGCSQSGALGYFADNLAIINLDGVVNKDCYDSIANKKNMEYIRESNIEYVIGWDVNIKFIKSRTLSYKPDDLIFLGDIEGFKSWGYTWQLYRVNYD